MTGSEAPGTKIEGPPLIFVVDDEAALTEALTAALGTKGYAVRGFTSAHSALTALADGACDLLLVDLHMPQMDGTELLRAALRIEPSLVGVVMTGEGSVAAAVEAMKAGALDFILKPFDLSAILPVLQRALQVRRLRQENAALEERVRQHAAEVEVANANLAQANRELEADPAFAMPRLHLILLARRAGDREAQRRELGLLQREDASRLLLFGGGFGRDALIALCRAELRACGAAA
jgi:FixJ family two-component response regulator